MVRVSWIIQVGPATIMRALCRKVRLRKRDMITEAETGVMGPQAKEQRQSLKARRQEILP